jgi:hypothetical protein
MRARHVRHAAREEAKIGATGLATKNQNAGGRREVLSFFILVDWHEPIRFVAGAFREAFESPLIGVARIFSIS